MKEKIMKALKRLVDAGERPTYRAVMRETGLTYAQVNNTLNVMRVESGAKTTEALARL